MCIIIAKPIGVDLPCKEHLIESDISNPHGMGLSYMKKGMDIHIKKDFEDVHDLIEYMNKNVSKDDSLVIHFRYATDGLRDAGNRHPFCIANKSNMDDMRKVDMYTDMAVSHNGVFYGYEKHKVYSDTQLFIADILADEVIRNNLTDLAIYSLLKEYIGFNKLAIQIKDVDDIILIGNFIRDDNGCYYSNKTYISWKSTYSSSSWGGTTVWSDDEDYSSFDTTKEYTIYDLDFDEFELCNHCATSDAKVAVYLHAEGFYIYLCPECNDILEETEYEMYLDSNVCKCLSCGAVVSLTVNDFNICPGCGEYIDIEDNEIYNI